MTTKQPIYIGTDSGATTSKVGGVWNDGSTISTKLLQQATDGRSENVSPDSDP
jgi:glucokinase